MDGFARNEIRTVSGKVDAMFDNVASLIGAYAVMTAGLSVAVATISPTIGPRIRHVFSGAAPLAIILGVRSVATDSVTLQSMDLFAAGGLVIFGVVASNALGKLVPANTKDARQRLT